MPKPAGIKIAMHEGARKVTAIWYKGGSMIVTGLKGADEFELYARRVLAAIDQLSDSDFVEATVVVVVKKGIKRGRDLFDDIAAALGL